MNKVELTGNIVKDIDYRKTPDGVAVVSNTIAVRKDYKNDKGEYGTDFINFVAWRGNAEYLRQYAKKGDRAEIVGTWQVRQYQTDKGENKTVNELIVENITVFSKKETEEKFTYKDAMKNEINDNDLPF